MLLVYGTKVLKKDMGVLPIQYRCGHCNNVSNYKAFRIWRWFTIFWIPIFPIGAKHYYVTCPICEYGKEETKVEVEQLLQQEMQIAG